MLAVPNNCFILHVPENTFLEDNSPGVPTGSKTVDHLGYAR